MAAAQQILPSLPPSNESWLKRFVEACRLTYVEWRIRRIIENTVRDENAPCPACGHRDGKIRWASAMQWEDGRKGALVHQCNTCMAAWAESPIVKASAWVINIEQEVQHSFEIGQPNPRA